MIAVDTNVLLRYLLGDDKVQSVRASELMLSGDPVLVTDIVLSETVWTLKGKRYKLNKVSLINVLDALFREPSIVFEDRQVVWQALNDFKIAKPVKSGGKRKVADFPDALIVNKARYLAEKAGSTFKGVYTFDVAARQLPGTLQP